MTAHDQTLLGPYVLGALEPAEASQVADHLSGCAECREQVADLEATAILLGDVPPEAFLDEPPEDGDLLLQRTLRAARELEQQPAVATTATPRTRWLRVAGAAAAVGIVAMGAGVLIGRGPAGDSPVASPTATATAVPGSRHATGTEAATGTTISTVVEPRAGWSWVNVRLTGLEAGAQCEMFITDTAGRTHVAGSWVVTPVAARDGSTFSGGVDVPIDQVSSVEVKTAQGEHVVTVSL